MDEETKINKLSLTKTSIKSKIKKANAKFIIFKVNKFSEYKELANKTTFRLINIIAPTKIRFQNYCTKFKHGTFEDFLDRDEIKAKRKDYRLLQNTAMFHINNNSTKDDLFQKLIELEKFINTFMRPTWSEYFMAVAHMVAGRSNCIKQRVGAVVVKDNRIVSTGYNGTPHGIKNCYEGECPRCNEDFDQGIGLDQCYCIHAEENALLEVGKVESRGATLYSTVYPCLLCSKILVQCGITEVIYDKDYHSEQTDVILNKAAIKMTKWKSDIPTII
jgi:dCMP deaminase